MRNFMMMTYVTAPYTFLKTSYRPSICGSSGSRKDMHNKILLDDGGGGGGRTKLMSQY